MTQEQYKLKMKDLIDNWQQRNGTVKTVQHKREVELLIDHTQNFICDGVVCPEKWFSQSIRPLYLLKEAYGEGSRDLIADHLCKSGQIRANQPNVAARVQVDFRFARYNGKHADALW